MNIRPVKLSAIRKIGNEPIIVFKYKCQIVCGSYILKMDEETWVKDDNEEAWEKGTYNPKTSIPKWRQFTGPSEEVIRYGYGLRRVYRKKKAK